MSTGFLSITQWIEAALRQAPAVAGGDIERSKERRVAEGSDAAVRIYPQSADGKAAAIKGGFHSWRFEVSVECLARAALTGTDKGDAEAAADVLLQAVWQRLAAATPPAGIDSVLINPRVAWELVQADRPLAAATLTFSVGLNTHNATLAAWS